MFTEVGRVRDGLEGRVGTGYPHHQAHIAFLIISVVGSHAVSWFKHLEDQKLSPPFHQLQSLMIAHGNLQCPVWRMWSDEEGLRSGLVALCGGKGMSARCKGSTDGQRTGREQGRQQDH